MTTIDQTAYIAGLIARRTEIISELSVMTKLTVGGKPNAMSADGGTSVDHVKWRLSLYDELEKIDKALMRVGAVENGLDDAAWEIESIECPLW